MEARLAEFDRLHDWRSTVFVTGSPTDEPVVRAGTPLRHRAKPKPPAQIRAYVFGDDKCANRSAFGMPFEIDGALCDGVIGHSVVLDDREREAVLALVTEAEAEQARGKSRPRVRCDFNPHHAFVFFDEMGIPTGRLETCFECGQFQWGPSPDGARGGYEPPVMTDEERRAYADILDRHGLGAWAFYYDGAEVTRLMEYDSALYGERGKPTPRGAARTAVRLALPPPIDRDLPPKQSSARDRHRLCLWWGEQWLLRQNQRMQSRGYECETGVKYDFSLEDGDCEKKFLQCDAPTHQIEDCLRAFTQPEIVCKGMPEACAGLEQCVPGLRFTPAK